MVAQACPPRYSGGRDWVVVSLKTAQARLVITYLKTKIKTKDRGACLMWERACLASTTHWIQSPIEKDRAVTVEHAVD
jgi:hypothetical protein